MAVCVHSALAQRCQPTVNLNWAPCTVAQPRMPDSKLCRYACCIQVDDVSYVAHEIHLSTRVVCVGGYELPLPRSGPRTVATS